VQRKGALQNLCQKVNDVLFVEILHTYHGLSKYSTVAAGVRLARYIHHYDYNLVEKKIGA
jgi:hypothetical protein